MRSKYFSFFTAILLSIGVSLSSWADDIDIYLGTNQDQVVYPPNILFVIDNSLSMRIENSGVSRLNRVQSALDNVLQSATNINTGLMMFNVSGGRMAYPIQGIDASTNTPMIYTPKTGVDDAFEINNVVNVGISNDITSWSTVGNIGGIMRLTHGTRDVHTGLRFPDVRIPQGATITNAYLRLFSQGVDTRNAQIKINGELVSDSAIFTNQSSNISNRSKTNAQVTWNTNHAFPAIEMEVLSPSITNVVQEIVDQGSWCGGNAMSIIIEATSSNFWSSKRILSTDNGGGFVPQLVVEYDQASASGCVKDSKRYTMQTHGDNLEELPDGTHATGSDLDLNSEINNFVGLRFNNLAIPNNATIISANLTFTSSESSNTVGSFTIEGLSEANVDDFREASNNYLQTVPKTSSVTMTMPPVDLDERTVSPNLSGIVQNIVNQGAWQQGNSLGFVLSNFTGDKKIYSYQGNSGMSPVLSVVYKATGLNDPQTTRDQLISQLYSSGLVNRTPIVPTLVEAASYFAGDDVKYGLKRRVNNANTNNRRMRPTRVSVESSYVGEPVVRPGNCDENKLNDNNCNGSFIPEGAKYISPIEDLQCEVNNHIVLLTDGQAVNDVAVNANDLAAKLGIGECAYVSRGSERCGTDLVRNLADGNVSIAGIPIRTHTIGFDLSSTGFLEDLASSGNGRFYNTNDAEELERIFNSILVTAQEINTTFLAPGVAVNQNNRLSHRNELYYGVFEPASGPDWLGNLKRFGIDGENVLDANGQEAIDLNTGFFKDTSKSYWSSAVDGPNAGEGGAASRLGTSRNIYVFDGAGTIMSNQNRLHETNTSITANDLNLQNEPDPNSLRTEVLKWARGLDMRDSDDDGVLEESRRAMGDPLHAQPVVVDYSDTDSVIFVATNQGFLHSFDTDNGNENFAIMPAELLPNLKEFYFDVDSTNHVYGLDGHMVVRRTSSGRIILYVGMRRGGDSYYAFDVTNKTAPTFLFSIDGGDTGFDKLGQTWAKPVVTQIKIGSATKDVLIFSGGYDVTQDHKLTRSPDTIGNAVYIVDADNGSLLWSAGNHAGATLQVADMQYSMPGGVAAIDRDNDGLADHMYVSDMGGQIFRFDIYNGESGADLIRGQMIADFGGASPEDNRRFYYAPDVSLVSSGDKLYYGVAIGSGMRASPLDQVINDRLYLVKDESVFVLNDMSQYTFPDSVITESSLYDATSGLLASSDSEVVDTQRAALAGSNGWKIRLTTSGEKVMASPIIIDFKVFFTTYVPAASNPSLCAPSIGTSRAYLVDLLNANSVNFQNAPDTAQENVENRVAETGIAGIAPNANFVVASDGDLAICLGTFCTSTEPEIDINGNIEACNSELDCLTDNLLSTSSRIRQGAWRTEIEN